MVISQKLIDVRQAGGGHGGSILFHNAVHGAVSGTVRHGRVVDGGLKGLGVILHRPDVVAILPVINGSVRPVTHLLHVAGGGAALHTAVVDGAHGNVIVGADLAARRIGFATPRLSTRLCRVCLGVPAGLE